MATLRNAEVFAPFAHRPYLYAQMPELAEVEFFRKAWNPGAGEKVLRVHLHPEKRIFRGEKIELLRSLERQKLLSSEAAGKQILFRFSGDLWLGIHLGMTGTLSSAAANHSPEKHEHLVLFTRKRALVFRDPRQFGRVHIARGKNPPAWWTEIGPAVTSRQFTVAGMSEFLRRHARLPIKAALLLQDGFPGIGNWMADEILWRAGIAPKRAAASLNDEELKLVWGAVRFVARGALKKVGANYEDVPPNWLFHQRWKAGGVCPRHGTELLREEIRGRTAAWCPRCQH